MRSVLIFIFAVGFSFANAKEKLNFIGEFSFPTGEKFKETEIGGLSGIYYDTKTSRFLAVSDDRSQRNPARFYEFNIKFEEKSISVTPFEVVTLKDENGKPFEKNTIDFEGITLVNDEILISSEGSLSETPIVNPELLKFSRDGKLKERLKIPPKFLPDPKDRRAPFGARDNLVFEALSASINGKVVFMGMEAALKQDGEISTLTDPSLVRIIKYNDLKPGEEYIYPLDKIPAEGRSESVEADNGLVDLAVVDESTFYTMERSYLPKAGKNVIKIFKVSNVLKADDVSKKDSIQDETKLKILKKELMLNLDDITKKMDFKNRKLDNIEGICFGPNLPNGHRTLVVVSDNNFSRLQRTLFIAFEITP